MKKSLAVLWLSHFFLDFFTGIWPIYKTIAGLDIALAGMLAGLSGFVGELMQLYFGYLSDQGHRKKVLLTGLILGSSILWVTYAASSSFYFLILLGLALGSGAFHPAAVGIAGSMTAHAKGRLILLFASGGALGLGCSQLIYTQVLRSFDGSALILFAPLALVMLWVCTHRFPEHSVKRGAFSWEALKKHRKSIGFLYLSQVANYALGLSFMFLLPDLLREKGSSEWFCMGGGQLCYVLSASLTMVPVGICLDKFGQKPVFVGILLASIVLFYLFLFGVGGNLWLDITLLSLLGGSIGVMTPTLVSWGHKIMPESPSTVSGVMMGAAWAFASMGPIAAGALASYFIDHAFTYTLAAMGLLLGLICLFIRFVPTTAAAEEVVA